MRVAGPTRGLLTAERTALNFASHLSGVATATARWVDALEGTRARVLDTRKTLPATARCRSTPCAAAAGSTTGSASRDRAMVKDNHVDRRRRRGAGATRPCGRRTPDLRVEVEVTDLDQLRELLDAGCDRDPARQHGHRRRWPRRCAITAGRADARGLRRADPRAGPRGRRDRRRLHLGRRADPLGAGLRPRHGPRDGG